MARHRNIRSMNISDEYEGYDDVYGHSVEDDYCISPSDAAQFLYDREGSKGQQRISSFLKSDEDIAEEDETVADRIASLDEYDQARLESCIDQIKSTIGLDISKLELVDIILKYKFDTEASINDILSKETARVNKVEKVLPKERDAFNNFNTEHFQHGTKSVSNAESSNDKPSSFASLSSLVSSHLKNEGKERKFNIPKLFVKSSNVPISTNKQFTSLSDLTQNHLKNSIANKSRIFGENTTNLNLVNENLANISLQSKNKIKEQDTDNTEWCIDLTNALRDTPNCSALSKTKINQELEIFTPQFINCDEPDEVVQPKKTESEFCKMDIKDIIFLNSSLGNRVSQFGKVITRTFRYRVPHINFSCNKKKMSKFMFDSPSPDDTILRSLRRK